MTLRHLKSLEERQNLLEKDQRVELKNIRKVLIDREEDIHCENLIGAISLPVGIAGPLELKGENVKNETVYIPLATTEGALVASVSRGCKAITLSGGALVNAHRVGTTRGPVFYTGSIRKSEEFYQWLKRNEKQLTKVAESTSSHLSFKKYDIRTVGSYAFIRFYFDTQDAMGMNMATIASEKMVDYISEKTGFQCLSLAGNFDVDKKAAWMNFINNRGFKVWAEVVISARIVKEVLKTTLGKIFDVWLAKCMIGSAMSGSLGFNAHFANVVAAFFAATGQDLAHVVEGSLGITTMKVLPSEDLYISIYLPAVMLGTVGGGTGLKTQEEARSITGVNTSIELAEVVGGAVLAGELSLLASLSEGSLAKAHKKLGR
ncbi:hydroxymethylglutaryl-CoA reductase [Candidatus Roizmanbacteria bacterium]|nr:hydroxymethylglutaryl-CoA reductase [Candidatus Roizmanbacteria bacterium]